MIVPMFAIDEAYWPYYKALAESLLDKLNPSTVMTGVEADLVAGSRRPHLDEHRGGQYLTRMWCRQWAAWVVRLPDAQALRKAWSKFARTSPGGIVDDALIWMEAADQPKRLLYSERSYRSDALSTSVLGGMWYRAMQEDRNATVHALHDAIVARAKVQKTIQEKGAAEKA